MSQVQGTEERAAEHTSFKYVSSAATEATQQMGIFQHELNSKFLALDLPILFMLIFLASRSGGMADTLA